MYRSLDKSLVEFSEVLNVDLAERSGPLVTPKANVLTGQAVMEQFEGHVFAQVLEALEV